LGKNPKLASQKRSSVDEKIKPVVSFKFSTVENKYNQLLLNFKGNYSVEFRAFDDGVAYRFITRKKGEIDVMHEDFNISFPDDYLLHLQYTGDAGFATYYEEPYTHLESKEWTPDSAMSVLPVLIDTRKNTKIFISEADLNDYPCAFFKGTGEKNGITSIFPHAPLEVNKLEDMHIAGGLYQMHKKVSKEADYIARTAGSREFPWRYFVIVDNDGQLLENTMVCRLSPQSVLDDASWIKPGLVIWDWMNRYSYGPGVDFEPGVNTASYKYFIDFAAKYNIPYCLLDLGWTHDLVNPLVPVPEVDLPEIVRYGKEKNVDILLWMSYRGIDKDLDDDSYNIFEHYAKMGVKGFKIDFLDRSDQWMIRFYERAAAEAAKHRLYIEFHGSYTPRGLEYKYPNVLSLEGVMGLENMGRCTPDNSVYLPFIRNVAGPMSFTPGSMLNVQPEQYKGGFIGTRAYHMALYVLFESGLQMISDSPVQFYQNPDCSEFIFSTPVTWDETRALAAEVGEYLIVAKRKGDKWWIGGMTNNKEKKREFDVNLDFLTQGKSYNMTVFEDGTDADRQAMDYRIRQQQVKQGDKIHVKLARNGGFAARID
jgi:alpha-glucosidase